MSDALEQAIERANRAAQRVASTAGAGLGISEQSKLGSEILECLLIIKTEAQDAAAKLISALWLVPKDTVLGHLQDDFARAQRLLKLEERAADNVEGGPQPPSIESQIGIGWRAVFESRQGSLMTVVGFTTCRTGGPSPIPALFPDGGPEREVVDMVACAWHDEQGRPHAATYPFGALHCVPPRAVGE